MEINIICNVCGSEMKVESKSMNNFRIEFSVKCEDCQSDWESNKDIIDDLESENQKLHVECEKWVQKLIDKGWDEDD